MSGRPSDPGSDIDNRRADVLARVAKTYAGYRDSGYDVRWQRQRPGSVLAREEFETWLAEALSPAAGGTVVDLGCGGAGLALVLERAAARPARYIGVDILEDRIAIARERVPWGEFLLASADAVPLEDGSVEAVVAVTLLSSLPAAWFRAGVAREVRRLLRPDGLFVVYDIRYPSPNRNLRPVTTGQLRALFPGWELEVRSITLLPPLARSRLAAGARRYRMLSAIPALRSHMAAVLRKPT